MFPGMHLRGTEYVTHAKCILAICSCIWVPLALGLSQHQCRPCGQDPAGDIQSIIGLQHQGTLPSEHRQLDSSGPHRSTRTCLFFKLQPELSDQKRLVPLFHFSFPPFLSYPWCPPFQAFLSFIVFKLCWIQPSSHFLF